MGEVFILVLTAEINRATELLGPENAARSALLFAGLQEAESQFDIEESISGFYYVTPLNPGRPITWSAKKPSPLCRSGDASCPVIVAPQS